MKVMKRLLLSAAVLLVLYSCDFVIPYVSLDVDSLYTTADISIFYGYVGEQREQRCVWSLYNNSSPSDIIDSGDEIMPDNGTLKFTGLAEGNYTIEFAVYSEKDGEYFLLNFMVESDTFTVDYP